MKRKIVLSGLGNVGREFIRLVYENSEAIKQKYNLELVITGIIGSKVSIYKNDGLDLKLLYNLGKGSDAILKYKDTTECKFSKTPFFEGNVFVEASHTNIENGEPGLSLALQAISSGMNIVFLSKGALVTSFKRITKAAEENKVLIKYSGATAAALPTMDIGEYSLAGSKILSINGVLNGTTNYILTEMHEKDISFEEAVQSLKDKGISEKDMDLDIKGIDSACKLLLLSNSLMGTNFSLSDIDICGIQLVTQNKIKEARKQGKVIKLLCRVSNEEGKVKARVYPGKVSCSEILYNINGTNKGAVFNTDSMGEVAVIGGASNPRGAAAAALKDIINMHRY